jgi:hypothetical protein
VKVWNLTDVATPVLQQRALVNVSVRVGDADLCPGASLEAKDSAKLRTELGPLLLLGAVHFGEERPAAYLATKKSAHAVEEERQRLVAEQEAEIQRKAEAAARAGKVEEEKLSAESEMKGKSK